MKISKQMVRSYLRHLFMTYDDIYEEAPDALSGYQKDIENMRLDASFFGDLDSFNLGLGYILRHPKISVLEFVESSIEYDEEEVLGILKYAWEILSQDKKKFLESKLSLECTQNTPQKSNV